MIEYDPVSRATRHADGSIARPVPGSMIYVSNSPSEPALLLGPLYERVDVPDWNAITAAVAEVARQLSPANPFPQVSFYRHQLAIEGPRDVKPKRIDWFGLNAVLEAFTAGMREFAPQLSEALKDLVPLFDEMKADIEEKKRQQPPMWANDFRHHGKRRR